VKGKNERARKEMNKIKQPNPKIATQWKHKVSGKIVKVAPWYEIPDPIVGTEAHESEQAFGKDMKDRKVKFGVLVQIGWLIENGQNCFLGVGLNAAKHFDKVKK